MIINLALYIKKVKNHFAINFCFHFFKSFHLFILLRSVSLSGGSETVYAKSALDHMVKNAVNQHGLEKYFFITNLSRYKTKL